MVSLGLPCPCRRTCARLPALGWGRGSCAHTVPGSTPRGGWPGPGQGTHQLPAPTLAEHGAAKGPAFIVAEPRAPAHALFPPPPECGREQMSPRQKETCSGPGEAAAAKSSREDVWGKRQGVHFSLDLPGAWTPEVREVINKDAAVARPGPAPPAPSLRGSPPWPRLCEEVTVFPDKRGTDGRTARVPAPESREERREEGSGENTGGGGGGAGRRGLPSQGVPARWSR